MDRGPGHFRRHFWSSYEDLIPILFIIEAKILMLTKWSHRFPPPQYVDFGVDIGYHVLSTQPYLFIINLYIIS